MPYLICTFVTQLLFAEDFFFHKPIAKIPKSETILNLNAANYWCKYGKNLEDTNTLDMWNRETVMSLFTLTRVQWKIWKYISKTLQCNFKLQDHCCSQKPSLKQNHNKCVSAMYNVDHSL